MINIMSLQFFDCISHIPHRICHLAKGELLFERSDPVTRVFRVVEGEVRLVRRQLDGAEYILQRATPGSLLAEASLMTDDYHCAAVAAEVSVVDVWSADRIRAQISTDIDTAQAYTALLASEMRHARLRTEMLSLRKVTDRLDTWLVWNGEEMTGKGSWYRIAQEINVSPEALYRELARRR